MKAKLSWIATTTQGRHSGADVSVAGVSIDSRSIEAGQLFIALRGERFDGHDFVGAAERRGAAALMVERPLASSLPQVVVGDCQQALTALAGAWRRQCAAIVVGVAGSNGKTTTKEMLAAILGQMGPVLATRGNLNNHIGVPLTLLRLEAAHRTAVIEIGANHPGEVAALAALVTPRIGLVTNAGAEHLEGFGSLEGVARAEGELFAALGAGDIAVINADDPFLPLWLEQSTAGLSLTFGTAAGAVVRAEGLRTRLDDGAFVTEFEMHIDGKSWPVSLALAGRHNVINALAAAAAAVAAGATAEAIVQGLAQVQPVAGRLQLKPGLGGAWLIDDSYNANPSSMRAGIDVLASVSGEHWMVLGEMGELGEHAPVSHIEIGDYARRAGITRLFALGEQARHAVASFGSRAEWFADAEVLGAAVAADLDAGITVLVKGSRMNRLERVVEQLLARPATAANGH